MLNSFAHPMIFADRMVNWCPHLRTVLSDIEVDYETIDKLYPPEQEQTDDT